MALHSFHLLKTSYAEAIKGHFKFLTATTVPGLRHAEWMTGMTLGAPLLSPSRVLLREVAVFAEWEDAAALDRFLAEHPSGRRLGRGWHVRLRFTRRWGEVAGFDLPLRDDEAVASATTPTVVAVTLARMRPLEIPRFISWGRPVECLVRDDPATTLSLAALRLPNTVSTFSIWRSAAEMTAMVHGHRPVPRPGRHAEAMRERDRRKFHFEFTTLRFTPLSEHGQWNGRGDYLPKNA